MQKRILCFGDSNTWGAVPDEARRHPDDVRWTGVLQRELGDGYKVIEEGHNGRTTVHDDTVENRLSGLTYFGPCLDSQSPLDLVIIMLGTNDLKSRFGVEAGSIAYGFGRYMDVLRITPMAGRKPEVLLVSPILINKAYENHPLHQVIFPKDVVERSKAMAKAYKEFADSQNIYFMDASLYGKASARDGVHMESEEHEKLGKAFAAKVKEILEKR